MKDLGLDVFELPEGEPAFKQPCTAFDTQACTIYTQRPHACRSYECRLFKSVRSGEIELEQALQVTQRARNLITELCAQMDEVDNSLPLERLVRYQWFRSEPPPAAAAILAELVRLLKIRFGVRWSPGTRRASSRSKFSN